MRKGSNNSAEVISLLNKIGERLISYEKENLGFKNSLAALEVKSLNNEELSKRLHNRIEKDSTKNDALRAQQVKLKETQQAFLSKVKYLDQLTEKLESTITEQNKINRRLESIVNERARMLRKIERIEETVLDTQNALEAKAMVLLTDKNVNDGNPVPETIKASRLEKRDEGVNDNKPAFSPLLLRIGIVSVFVTLMLLSMNFFYPQGKAVIKHDQSTKNLANKASISELAENVTTEVNKYFPETISNSPLPLSNTELVDENKESLDSSQNNGSNNLSIFDEEQILAELEKNPEKVAEQFNQITPALGTAKLPDSVTEEQQEDAIQKVAFNEGPKQDFDISSFLASQAYDAKLVDRVSPDDALPPKIKEIEAQAFEKIPEAQHDLAAIYTAGHAGVPINYKKAAAWFKEAALNGVANARYNLGVLYHQGIGVDQNTNLAINWYKAAAQLGHPEAQYNLGIAYIEGIGVIFDAYKAAHFFESAANSGIMEAAYNLGLIHENGLLGKPDYYQAVHWYKKSSNYGSEEATAAIEQLAKTLNMSVTELEEEYLSAKDKSKDKATQRSENIPQSPVRSLSNKDFVEPESSAATSNSKKSKQIMISQIQELLISAGLFPGPVDGVLSPILEDSIRSYQSQHKIEITGLPSEKLLDHMASLDESKGFGSRE